MTNLPEYKTNDPRGWCGDPTRGAALGRPSKHSTVDWKGDLYLEPILLDEGGYDRLGTYFGIGLPLFWYASTDGTIDAVTRATNVGLARLHILNRYPNANFIHPRT